MLYNNLGAHRRHFIHFIHILAFEGDTSIRPVLISVDGIIVMRPGTMDGDPIPDLRRSGDQSLRLALIELGDVRSGRIIQVHDLIPFFMGTLRDDMISAFRSLAVAHDHLVIKGFVPEYSRVSGIPAIFVKQLQFIAGLHDQDIYFSFGGAVKKTFAGGPAGIPEGEQGDQ